jgi:hypothetical protein
LETPWFLGFEQMRRFVTLYHVVSVILANALDNWGTRPTPKIQHYILWSFMPIMLYGVKIIFFNACNLYTDVAELDHLSPMKGRDLQATGFSGHAFAKLRQLKNNILCVRVRSSVDCNSHMFRRVFPAMESRALVL